MNIKSDTVGHVFSYHAPTEYQILRYGDIRSEARNLAYAILAATPESRERSLALTKLQEVVMWANASIAINESAPPETDMVCEAHPDRPWPHPVDCPGPGMPRQVSG